MRFDNSHNRIVFSHIIRQPQTANFPPQNQNFLQQNQNFQAHSFNYQTRPTFEVFIADPNYMPYTQQSTTTSHKLGFPNHLTTVCTVGGNPLRRGMQKPFIQN